MLITFKSGVCADVMMFGDIAKQMMELMGKEPAERGVITVEQLPEAVARLKQAVAQDRQLRQATHRAEERDDGRDEEEKRERVSVTQRALPLIELLECSLREEKAVVWGV